MSRNIPVIHIDPEIMHGTPVFVGTRVPAVSLWHHLEAGDSLAEFLEQFPSVRREQAVRLIRQVKERAADAHSAMPRKFRRSSGFSAPMRKAAARFTWRAAPRR